MEKDGDAMLTRIKNQTRMHEIAKAKRKWYVDRAKLVAKVTAAVICTCFLLFRPVETGAVIGTFIHEFFGTMVEKAMGK